MKNIQKVVVARRNPLQEYVTRIFEQTILPVAIVEKGYTIPF